MIRRQHSTWEGAARPLRAIAALATLATVTLSFGAMVVLPARLDVRYATLAAQRTIVEVIGPTRLGRATPAGNHLIGKAMDAPHAFADRLLDRVAARSGRARESGRTSGSLD
jgi:hypothetical protein